MLYQGHEPGGMMASDRVDGGGRVENVELRWRGSNILDCRTLDMEVDVMFSRT